MKKLSLCISMILALTLLAFCLTGCDENSEVTTFASEESSTTAETTKKALTSVKPEESSSEETTKAAEPAKMIGSYKSGDGSTVVISENGGTYRANISIYKLMNVTLSGSISGGTINLSGPDPDGGTFKAEVIENGNGIKLTFTSSSWAYIRSGESFNFSK